jgi:hypothetical protein
VVAKRDASVKQAAQELGVTAKWIRRQIAAGRIAPRRVGDKRNGRFVLSESHLEVLRGLAAAPPESASAVPAVRTEDADLLERMDQLGADRTNLLAQVAWARAIVREQESALSIERARSERLEAEVSAQRSRVEALKALSVVDRVLGRHKAI